MAYTATKSAITVFGDQRVWQGLVTADASSGTVDVVGGKNILQVSWSPQSMSTGVAPPRFRKNATAAGVATVGILGISGAVSGDEFFVTIYYK